MRITNEKGWETIPGETGSSCTERSPAFVTYPSVVFVSLFVSILVLSRFECFTMSLGCVPFISLLSRFTVFSRRLATQSRAHLSIPK